VIDNHMITHHDAPEAPHHCHKCGDGFTDPLQRFAGVLACDPCIRIGRCVECREAWAAEGADYCNPCSAAFYRKHPGEFTDAYDVLRMTTNGREIIRLVTGNPTAYELARESTEAALRGDVNAASLLLQEALIRRRA
jgi:hypothetical protein